ncbi:MAG: hypothetical protein ACE37F_09755 [Nannocystaceae bacterium]|nr:hypothetical protein [bacterium]
MKHDPGTPYEGGVKHDTINVHYHQVGDGHWKLAIERGNDQELSEVEDNTLILDPTVLKRFLVTNVDNDSGHKFTVELDFQGSAADARERLRSEGLVPEMSGNKMKFTFTLAAQPLGQGAKSRAFEYRPAETDVINVATKEDDPRFKIKFKT